MALNDNIIQTAQDHVAQIARLRAAKEEAEAKHVEIQREMKEEMERLRTQFIFKVMLSIFNIFASILTSSTATRNGDFK